MASSPPRRAAVAFILVTVTLDVLSLGIVIPVLAPLIEDFLGGNTERAARMFGVFGTVWALMQFGFAPVLGALSDRLGRRPVILVSNFGLGFDYVLMALAPTLGWLFVGRVISGITSASYATAGAYIADVTPVERRAAAFGMIGAAFGVGFILGPALGGVLGDINPRLPFWIAAALTLLNATYGLFVLPESLPPERRKEFDWRRANPVGSLRLLRSHRELSSLATVFFLYMLAHNVLPSVFVLYAGYRYGWTARAVGLVLAGVGVLSVIVQGGLVRRLVPALGERRVLLLGITGGALGFLIYGLAGRPGYFLAGMPIFALMGLFSPAIQGLMTRRVGASEQGQLQGATSSITGVAGLIGPGLFTLTFATFIGSRRDWHVPGAPFLLASGLMFLALMISWRVTGSGDAVPAS